MVRLRKTKNPHTALVQAIEKVLQFRKDCYLWKNNTGAVTSEKRFIRYVKVGSSDFIGLTRNGQFLAIECKTGDAVQSKHQKLFQIQIEAMGGRYFVVRSIVEFIAIMDFLAE